MGHDEQTQSALEQSVLEILKAIGEDSSRDGLKLTPSRVADMLGEVTRGYTLSPDALLEHAVFDIDSDSMIVIKDIEFYSLCEHHLLPFYGKIHVGYIPNGKAVGLGKIPKVIELFARRLQVQERLTEEVADLLEQTINPKGIGVVAEAFHLCLAMRGMQTQGARLITSAMHGSFRKDARTRGEFLQLIEKGNRS
jgi:GTP cyclohydrolase I